MAANLIFPKSVTAKKWNAAAFARKIWLPCFIRQSGNRADERIDSLSTRYELRLAMLQHRLQRGPAEELRWFVVENDCAIAHVCGHAAARSRAFY